MIECRFIYQFPDGATSDSLDQIAYVHAVPSVGDAVCFVGGNDHSANTNNRVTQVVHYLAPKDRQHNIVVLYSGPVAAK